MPGIRVGVGLSQHPDASTATRSAVRDALAQAGSARANWALCFFTAPHLSHADTIRRTVLDLTGCESLCGCSAMGVLGAGVEVERTAAVTVLVGSARQVNSHSAILPRSGEGLAHFRHLGQSPERQTVLVLLPDAFQVNHALLHERMSAELKDTPVLGAGSTDDGTVGISLQIGMEGVRSGSVAALGLYGPLRMEVGITQSCCAVGEPHFITQAREQVLVDLDGRPALHAFIEQGRALGLESMQQAAQELLFGFPLDSAQPQFVGEACLVRQLAGFDQATHGLVVPYPLRAQTTMGFMHRNPATAEQDLSRMVDGVARRLDGPPDFGLYFDCAARGRGLYGRPGVDVAAIHQRLGPFPLAGMFGGFELATALGEPRLYTYTGVLALFRLMD
jgi:small ligand-binding sensory domain FIST